MNSPHSSEYEGSDLEALAVLKNYRDWILSHFRPYLAGEIAEIGAGVGSYSREIARFARRLHAVEPSASLIPALREACAPLPGVHVHESDFGGFSSTTPSGSLDALVFINVLEHIEDDVWTLRESFRMLRPGGRLLIFVPALPFLYSPLDRSLGHFRRYRRSELHDRTHQCGFTILDLRWFDTAGIFPWWLIHTLGGRTRFDARSAGIYDRVVIPVMRPVESALPMPIGKNLLMIARKDG